MIVRYRRIRKTVELRKLVDIIPDSAVVGMKYMGSVPMDMDPLHIFGINIARNMIPAVDHQDGPARCFCLLRKDAAVKSRANDEIIIMTIH